MSSLGTLALDAPSYLWWLLILLPMVALVPASRRKLGTTRRAVSTAVRVLLVLCLVLALAGLTRMVPVDSLGVVFVLDRSASVSPEQQREALEFVQASLEHAEDEDAAGVVVFGGQALVDASPAEKLDYRAVESSPSPHHSDLASGLRLATALLPSDRSRRVVLLSDGEETLGDSRNQVLLTAGEDLQISVVPLEAFDGPDVLLEELLVPARVDEGAAFELKVVARSEGPAKATLRLYRNEQYLGEREVELGGGRAEVERILQTADKPGLYRYRASIEVHDEGADARPQNNEVVGTVQVMGRPRVLYAEGYPDQARHLARVIREQDVEVDVVRADQIPAGLEGMRRYSAIVLSDIPAYALTQRQQEALQSYVRDLGRGLVMVGGDQSFGVGGYYKTPVEEALPVRVDLEDKTRFPKLGMVLAIDKSCSMGGGAGSKIALAREASIRSVELLQEGDMIGVIGFDSAASWIVPLHELHDKKSVIDTIASIRAGGGTDIYPALKRGIDELNASDAALKHVILLSDGVTAGADFKTLLDDSRKRGVTTTSLTFGSDADRATMQDIAAFGGGNYYLVTDPKMLPAIFTRETMLATRSFLKEETFTAVPGAHSDLLEGLGASDLPTLHGYVATEPKGRSVVALHVGDEHESPLLAHWRYGLGRSVAWTSDAKRRWAKDWVGTPSYTKTWSNILRWAVGDTAPSDLDVAAEIREGELVVTVDAFDEDGDFRNFLEGEARVVAPDLTVRSLEMRQVAPGRYEATVPVDQDGSWLVGVAMRDGEDIVGQSVAEAVQPYSPEYKRGGLGPGRMAELGRLGGGGAITDPAQVFARPEIARQVPHALWPHLLWLAALLLLMDVAARRLELPGRRPATAVASMATAAARRRPAPRRKARGSLGVDRKVEVAEEPVVVDEAPSAPPKAEVAPESYAGRLLAARKRAQTKTGDEEDEA